MYHHGRGPSPPSDTTHYPIIIGLTCEYIRADRHVGPDFVLSGQVCDLEPELLVDSCLHGRRSIVDDVTEVTEAGDESADVVFGQLGGGLPAVLVPPEYSIAWLTSAFACGAGDADGWLARCCLRSPTCWFAGYSASPF
jgi:hypothetical protein